MHSQAVMSFSLFPQHEEFDCHMSIGYEGGQIILRSR